MPVERVSVKAKMSELFRGSKSTETWMYVFGMFTLLTLAHAMMGETQDFGTLLARFIGFTLGFYLFHWLTFKSVERKAKRASK